MHDSIENWITKFGDNPIPVLAHTAKKLAKLCSENVPIQDLVELVETDPGLTVQLIRTCSTSSQSRLRTEVTSTQQALMMLGTERLKNLPNDLPTVEKTLKGPAQEHLLKTFSIANHAARQSYAWAKLRRDMMPNEVTAAALLHFIGRMLMSIHAPELIDKINKTCIEEHIAEDEAQYLVMGFTFDQLSLEIADRWHLPALVIDALHAENASQPRPYSIMLAVQLARHAAIDWYSPKMRMIHEEASEWLNKPMSVLIKETHQLAVEIAHETKFYNILPAAARLLTNHVEAVSDDNPGSEAGQNNAQRGICIIPQISKMQETIEKLKKLPSDTKDLHDIIKVTMKGLHDGVGLNRVVFASCDKTQNSLRAYSIIGADNDPVFGQFQINMDKKNLFYFMSKKVQAVWINDGNREEYAPLLPEELIKIIKTDQFFCMSVVLNETLLGIFYADRHRSNCQLDKKTYSYFKAICMLTIQTIQRMPKLHA